MSANETPKRFARPPVEKSATNTAAPKKTAGGVGAVLSSLKHAQKEMGLIKGMRTLSKLNQTEGFDCPGCAWPDPEGERSHFEYCENGAKAVAEEATDARVTPQFFSQHSVSELSTWSDYKIGKSGRITTPVILKESSDHYAEISWKQAFDLIAQELKSLPSPDSAAFYTSGRTSNEAAFLYQLMVREFGTNNLPDCSNMCHESSGVALKETIGVGKGTVSLEDFNHADCILIVGQNPGTNHPRMLSALQQAVEKGAEIITINPIPEAGLTKFQHPQRLSGWVGTGTPLTSQFLPVRINGDVALIKGLIKEILEIDKTAPCLDRSFIDTKTEGFEAFRKDIEAQDWETILSESGVSRELIRKAAETIAKSKSLICCWAMGLTQHKNAVGNIQELVNLLLLGGHFGRPGAGACPVRGHSNVQGDRTVGIWERPSEDFLDRLGKAMGFEPPREHGVDTVSAIRAMRDGNIKVFFAMGGNFLSATPDTDVTAKALENCDLTVHVSTKLNRSHLIAGKTALILPCLGRSERDRQETGDQFVTVENSMGIVHPSEGDLSPASADLLSEVAIVCELAQRLLPSSKTPWSDYRKDYDKIRDSIEDAVSGFDAFNKRVRTPGGFALPNPVRDSQDFVTSSGKAHFTVHPIPKSNLAQGEFLLMTIRTHDQFNTTIYGLEDRYRGISEGRRVVLMNAGDIKESGFCEGDHVDLTSQFQGETRLAPRFQIVSYPIPTGCLATYFPEANALVHLDDTAEKSHTPAYKSVRVRLTKSEAG